jgi:Flp pilus assembly pilin Flp
MRRKGGAVKLSRRSDTSEGREVNAVMRALRRDARGQDLAEYALLISLISLALIAALTLIGGRITAMFQAVAGAL